MDFTFGIVTSANQEENVNKIIDSIESQQIPKYEIIVIGNCKIKRKNTYLKPFDESIKPGWITRKKNLITYRAKFENIVYLHDYICLEPGWYDGFKHFGNYFSVCSTKQIDKMGNRWIDWCLLHEDIRGLIPEENWQKRQYLLPYQVQDLSRFMYIAGNYWIAKKSVMLEFPQNEDLVWEQGEDIELSRRIRSKYNFSFNPNSTIKFLKEKGCPFTELPLEIVKNLRKHSALKEIPQHII